MASHEAIPASMFLDELIGVTNWGTIEPDPERSLAFVEWRGRRYLDMSFYTAEVVRLWPARTSGAADKPRHLLPPYIGERGEGDRICKPFVSGPKLSSDVENRPISDRTGPRGVRPVATW